MLTGDPTSSTDSLDLRAYLDVVLRRWRIILGVIVVAVLVALGWSFRQDKQYRAESEILIGTRVTDTLAGDSLSVYAETFNVGRKLTNAVERLESGVTVDAVAAAYDGPLNPEKVSASSAAATSDVVKVSVRAGNGQDAADLVNTYVSTFIDLQRKQRIVDIQSAIQQVQEQIDDLTERIDSIRQPLTEVESALVGSPTSVSLNARREELISALEPTLTPLQTQRAVFLAQLETLQLSAGIAQSGGAELLSEAKVPTSPVAPTPIRNGLIGAAAGLLLGIVAAFLRDSLDERIRGIDDLSRAAPGVAPFAVVPEARETRRGYVAMRDDGLSPVAEAYRSLRTSVKFAGLDQQIRVIQITSALPGEGKTTTVANLAEAFAQGGERVAVVCCDMRRPRIHEYFGQSAAPGFTDVLLGGAPLAGALRRVSDRLHILPAGSVPPNPSELLSSARATAIIGALADEFDVVLIDSTPVVPVTDALVVSRFVDATIVVVDVRTTKRKLLRQTVERLRQVQAPVSGLVLNGLNGSEAGMYGYGYGYGYGSDTGSKAAEGQPVGVGAKR